MNISPFQTSIFTSFSEPTLTMPTAPIIDPEFLRSLYTKLLPVSSISLPADNPHPSTNRVSISRIAATGSTLQTHIDFAYHILFELQHWVEGIPLQIAYFPVNPYDIKKRTKRKRRTINNLIGLELELIPQISQTKLKFS